MTDKNGKKIELTSSYWRPFIELCYKQLADKTFIVLFLFTIAWSNPNSIFGEPIDSYDPPIRRIYSNG